MSRSRSRSFSPRRPVSRSRSPIHTTATTTTLSSSVEIPRGNHVLAFAVIYHTLRTHFSDKVDVASLKLNPPMPNWKREAGILVFGEARHASCVVNTTTYAKPMVIWFDADDGMVCDGRAVEVGYGPIYYDNEDDLKTAIECAFKQLEQKSE